MKKNIRNNNANEIESGSYFVSMTDMMVGIVFIFLFLVMYFAIHYGININQDVNEQQKIIDNLKKEKNELASQNEKLTSEIHIINQDLEDKKEQIFVLRERERNIMKKILAKRNQIIETVKEKIEKANPEIHIIVDKENGVLRLSDADSSLFPVGESYLTKKGKKIVEMLAAALSETLPEYAFNSGNPDISDCRKTGIGLEAVLIEGHTDIRGDVGENWNLSTKRALYTYNFMKEKQPQLFEMNSCGKSNSNNLNDKAQSRTPKAQNDYTENFPLFSISGYAFFRGVEPNDTEEHMNKNRRIDLRFIMAPPSGGIRE